MGKKLWVSLVCACSLAFGLASPVASAAAPDQTDGGAPTTTVIVASEAPVPQSPSLQSPSPQAPSPRIGPFRGVASEPGVRAAWWLLIIGGGQVLALMFLTRRSRARVLAADDRP